MEGVPLIKFREEVREARDSGGPVVALESAMITHGLPFPDNLETALAMEQDVRDAGATPATICLLDGEIRAGLSETELARLAETSDALKVSTRGLAYALATNRSAGTTVSGTMWIAALAAIEFFGTGGIGGVHYGASESGDVSSDLTELSRTPVAVVCAGVKSILDIGRTMEHLETSGVPVFGYGTDEFPAFFSGSSGHPAPFRLDSASQAAETWVLHRQLGLHGGAVFACPPPVTVDNQAQLEAAIRQANQEAVETGIRGGDVTPFVLRRVSEITDGASIRVNIALLRNNARTAAEIAVEYQKATARS